MTDGGADGSERRGPGELLTLQMIVGALAMGVALFAAVALVIDVAGPEADPELANVLLAVLAFMAVGLIPVYFLVRRSFLSAARGQLAQREDRGRPGRGAELTIPEPIRILTIIGAALAESVGIFGTVIYMVTKAQLALIAPAVALVAILACMPTRGRLEALLESLTKESY